MSMINDRHPCDDPSLTEFDNVTEDDTVHGVHLTGWNVDAAGVDFPLERRHQSPSLSFREYPLVNTSGLDKNFSGGETAADVVRQIGSTFHEQFRPLYDQRVLPSHGPQGWPEALEGLTPPFTLQPPRVHHTVPRDVASHIRGSDSLGLYNLLGEPSGATQPHLDNRILFPSPQGGGLTHTSVLGEQPHSPIFDGDHVFSTSIHCGGGTVSYRDRGSPVLFASTSSPTSFYSAGEDSNAKIISPHAPPRRDGFPIIRDRHFGPGPLLSGVQDGNPRGVAPLPPPFGGGLSRPGTTDPSPPTPSLTSPSIELSPRGGKRKLHDIQLASRTATRNGAGPPGFRLITSGGLPESGQRLGKGKRKRPSDEPDGGTTRVLPRPRRNTIFGGPTQTRPILLPSFPHRIKIEQLPYVCGNSQHNWVQQNSIDFAINGQPGIKLTDALDRHFSGPDGRDDQVLQYNGAGSSISCRLSFLGYPSRSSQITTADHKKTHNPRTRKKLAFEVAKRVKRYVEELEVDMRYEDLVLTKIVHVSKASWQPEVWHEQVSAGNS